MTPSSYDLESSPDAGGALACSTTTTWLLVGLLAGIAAALAWPRGHRPHKDSVSETGGALIYPIIMMCVGTAIMAFLVAYVVPQVATIFEQQHVALPRATRLLIRFSALSAGHWLALIIPFVAIAAAVATPRGRRLYHYYDSRPIDSLVAPVMTIAMAAIIVFMMLAVLMPIFQLNQMMQ
jgi:type II secretory pathway component PulF